MLNKFINLFTLKNERDPDELGRLLYQVVQMGLSDKRLSAESLLDKLGLKEDDVVVQYQAEIIMALMFQVILVVERKYEYPLAGDILDGMTKEFISHLKEMGGSDEDLISAFALFQQRVKEYYEAESNTTGNGPAYWVGKNFYENLIGKQYLKNINGKDPDLMQVYIDMNLKFSIAVNYLTSTLVGVDSIVKKYPAKKTK